jgi:hypothetical protein
MRTVVTKRRWVRLRLLLRAEGLCDMAQRFLALHAKVAAMELLTCKLSEQILRAQVRGTTRGLLSLCRNSLRCA